MEHRRQGGAAQPDALTGLWGATAPPATDLELRPELHSLPPIASQPGAAARSHTHTRRPHRPSERMAATPDPTSPSSQPPSPVHAAQIRMRPLEGGVSAGHFQNGHNGHASWGNGHGAQNGNGAAHGAGGHTSTNASDTCTGADSDAGYGNGLPAGTLDKARRSRKAGLEDMAAAVQQRRKRRSGRERVAGGPLLTLTLVCDAMAWIVALAGVAVLQSNCRSFGAVCGRAYRMEWWVVLFQPLCLAVVVMGLSYPKKYPHARVSGIGLLAVVTSMIMLRAAATQDAWDTFSDAAPSRGDNAGTLRVQSSAYASLFAGLIALSMLNGGLMLHLGFQPAGQRRLRSAAERAGLPRRHPLAQLDDIEV